MSIGNFAMSGSGSEGYQTLIVDEILEGEAGYAKGPERALLSALLFDGVMGYMCYAAGGSGQRRYQEAFQWVKSRDAEYVFSFDNVCEGLGIDPQNLRLGLINAANSKKGVFKRSRRKGQGV